MLCVVLTSKKYNMKVKELFELGFKNNEGSFMTSKWIIKDDGWGDESSATLEYRPGKGILINSDDEVIFEKFRLCIYGSNTCPSIPLKIKSKEYLILFMQFF